MARNQERTANVIYGRCTNTSGKNDGTPCSKCQNKEIQAIRVSKDFICEECGEPLQKVDYKPPVKLPIIAIIIALSVIGCVVSAWFILCGLSEKESISITLNTDTLNLNVGDSISLEAIISTRPENADVLVSFMSDNDNVAHVGDNGTLLAISKGEAFITIVVKMEPGITDTVSAHVFVKEMPNEQPKNKQQEQKRTYSFGRESHSSKKNPEMDLNKPVNVSDDEVQSALNGLIGSHTDCTARIRSIMKDYFAIDAVVDEVGVNGINLVNYRLPIKNYLENICASKYLIKVRVLEVRRNWDGRLTYLKVQETHHRDPKSES